MEEKNKHKKNQHDREHLEKENKDTAENHGQNALRNESNDPGETNVPTSEQKLKEERKKGGQK